MTPRNTRRLISRRKVNKQMARRLTYEPKYHPTMVVRFSTLKTHIEKVSKCTIDISSCVAQAVSNLALAGMGVNTLVSELPATYDQVGKFTTASWWTLALGIGLIAAGVIAGWLLGSNIQRALKSPHGTVDGACSEIEKDREDVPMIPTKPEGLS